MFEKNDEFATITLDAILPFRMNSSSRVNSTKTLKGEIERN